MDRRFASSFTIVLAASLAACGGSTASDPATDGGATDSAIGSDSAIGADSAIVDAGPDVIADGPGDVASDANPECTALCDLRASKAKSDGWCEPFFDDGADGGFTKCADYCAAHIGGFTDEELAAFRKCLQTDPLCFQSLQQCMAKTTT